MGFQLLASSITLHFDHGKVLVFETIVLVLVTETGTAEDDFDFGGVRLEIKRDELWGPGLGGNRVG